MQNCDFLPLPFLLRLWVNILPKELSFLSYLLINAIIYLVIHLLIYITIISLILIYFTVLICHSHYLLGPIHCPEAPSVRLPCHFDLSQSFLKYFHTSETRCSHLLSFLPQFRSQPFLQGALVSLVGNSI